MNYWYDQLNQYCGEHTVTTFMGKTNIHEDNIHAIKTQMQCKNWILETWPLTINKCKTQEFILFINYDKNEKTLKRKVTGHKGCHG